MDLEGEYDGSFPTIAHKKCSLTCRISEKQFCSEIDSVLFSFLSPAWCTVFVLTFPCLIVSKKKGIHCKNIVNELKCYHNKTECANFVLMQDSWPQLKSDSISWRKTLKNCHNSQIQWLVVNTLCQETKVDLNQKVGSEGTPILGPYWKSQLVVYKVSVEWKSESSPWTRTILTRGAEFLVLIKLVTNLNNSKQDDNEQETSEMQLEDYSVKSNVRASLSRSNAEAKPQRRISASSSPRFINWWGKNLDRYWTTRLFAQRLSSVKETDQSSSSWESTSRKR